MSNLTGSWQACWEQIQSMLYTNEHNTATYIKNIPDGIVVNALQTKIYS